MNTKQNKTKKIVKRLLISFHFIENGILYALAFDNVVNKKNLFMTATTKTVYFV